MRTIGNMQFPEQGNAGECRAWTPYRRTRALARRVLVVAKTRIEGKWNAYCDAVPGENHDGEKDAVYQHGCKLEEDIALAIFPEYAGIPYAH